MSLKANDFQKITPTVKIAKLEKLRGMVADHGIWVLVKPPYEIFGKGSEGVFVSGSTVKLSPYYIGKYQVTYQLWQEVYNWAISHGYTFTNYGLKAHMEMIEIRKMIR